ncbi:MAG: hypothetical protein ACLTOV_05755 [Phocaeicola sp.]
MVWSREFEMPLIPGEVGASSRTANIGAYGVEGKRFGVDSGETIQWQQLEKNGRFQILNAIMHTATAFSKKNSKENTSLPMLYIA